MRLSPEQILQIIDDTYEHYATIGDREAMDVLSMLKEDIYGEDEAWRILDEENVTGTGDNGIDTMESIER